MLEVLMIVLSGLATVMIVFVTGGDKEFLSMRKVTNKGKVLIALAFVAIICSIMQKIISDNQLSKEKEDRKSEDDARGLALNSSIDSAINATYAHLEDLVEAKEISDPRLQKIYQDILASLSKTEPTLKLCTGSPVREIGFGGDSLQIRVCNYGSTAVTRKASLFTLASVDQGQTFRLDNVMDFPDQEVLSMFPMYFYQRSNVRQCPSYYFWLTGKYESKKGKVFELDDVYLYDRQSHQTVAVVWPQAERVRAFIKEMPAFKWRFH